MAGGGRRKADSAIALALAAGKTTQEAAKAAGVGERTVTRRLADPEFRKLVAKLQRDMVGRCLGRLSDGMTEAVDVLRKLLSASSETIRLGAARAILDFGIKGWDSLELDARVQDLERVATLHREAIGHE